MFTLSHLSLNASKHTQHQGAKVSLKKYVDNMVSYQKSYHDQLDPHHIIDYVAENLKDTGLCIRCLEKINKFINPYSLHDRGTPPLSKKDIYAPPGCPYIEGGPTKIFSKNSKKKIAKKIFTNN